jgi:hypothetical protein
MVFDSAGTAKNNASAAMQTHIGRGNLVVFIKTSCISIYNVFAGKKVCINIKSAVGS